MRLGLEALDHDQIDPRQFISIRQPGSAAAQFMHQRHLLPTIPAPRRRRPAGAPRNPCPHVDIETVMGVLMTETRTPPAWKCGISRASSVVLPAPLHPASPITFILLFSGTRIIPAVIARSTCDEAIQLPSPTKAGLLRWSYHRRASARPGARNDDVGRISFILKMLYIGQQPMSC